MPKVLSRRDKLLSVSDASKRPRPLEKNTEVIDCRPIQEKFQDCSKFVTMPSWCDIWFEIQMIGVAAQRLTAKLESIQVGRQGWCLDLGHTVALYAFASNDL